MGLIKWIVSASGAIVLFSIAGGVLAAVVYISAFFWVAAVTIGCIYLIALVIKSQLDEPYRRKDP